eukprot:TRINITY_DN70_c0_g1_i22.p1 TRINITY_DN70_c0_g1~~TRINITY_DN70_c0_g1_i22.p1  ORF type:complete len:108 (-),score=27.73 TRINITY_DN70_c0_g1_i22:365-688(-)
MGSQDWNSNRPAQHGWWNFRWKLEKASQQDVLLQLPGWGELLPPHDQLLGVQDSGAISDLPGPLCFSERIAEYPLCGKSIAVCDEKAFRPSERPDKSSLAFKQNLLQ